MPQHTFGTEDDEEKPRCGCLATKDRGMIMCACQAIVAKWSDRCNNCANDSHSWGP